MNISIEALGLLVKKAQYRQHRAVETKLAPLGVSLVQWNALREIERNPGVSLHRLAELTFNSDQAFGTLAARLLKLALIERRAGLGRATIHQLTPKGADILGQCGPLVQEAVADAFAPLSESDRVELSRLLTTLLDAAPKLP
ncbi:MAG TPA: MarR family transcriptional regulator [Janthinobacterium sp.]|nr:MarR family transcriptional regulator [Janthinobacterium sp.]